MLGLVKQEIKVKYVAEIQALRDNICRLQERFDEQSTLRLKELRKLHVQHTAEKEGVTE